MPTTSARPIMTAGGQFLVLVLTAGPALAQDISGSMSGTVLDPGGSPLPGVAVTLGSTVVPAATIRTQLNGTYRFPTLPPDPDEGAHPIEVRATDAFGQTSVGRRPILIE